LSSQELTDLTQRSGSEPLVSVIMPAYNYSHYIREAIKSLQAQTYARWECIIVDDGSTDDTHKVVSGLAEQDGRVRYVYQEHARLPAARNNGLRQCSGDYVQFLDADDLLETRKLERQVAYLEQHPEVDIVYGSVRYFGSERPDELLYSMAPANQRWMPETSGQGNAVLLKLVDRNILAVNSALLRRNIIADVGFFDEAVPLLEDWDYFIRCAAWNKHFHFYNTQGTLALVRRHESSISQNVYRMLQMEMLTRAKVMALTSDSEVLSLNQERIVQTEGLISIHEAGTKPAGSFYRLLRTSIRARKMRERLKWLACAFALPFVSGPQLVELTSLPVSQWPRLVLRNMKEYMLAARKPTA
jgi:glycosyltransferase involved in cell wall biosynthesis